RRLVHRALNRIDEAERSAPFGIELGADEVGECVERRRLSHVAGVGPKGWAVQRVPMVVLSQVSLPLVGRVSPLDSKAEAAMQEVRSANGACEAADKPGHLAGGVHPALAIDSGIV